jgi:hypothetical protein
MGYKWALLILAPALYPVAQAIVKKTTTNKDDKILDLIAGAYRALVKK